MLAASDPGDRLCYKIRCPAPSPPDTLVTDQFGTRTVTRLRARLSCTPAVKGGPPGPTMTTTTTTTALTTTITTTTTTSTTSTTLRFVDNGDGTVTDNQTGLQWEKKVAGSGCLHCVDDTYTWCANADNPIMCDNGNVPDGTAFTSFLATLNGGATGVGNCVSSDGNTQTGGFAGHCDWRLPTSAELQTILLAPFLCQPSPCIDPVFGPTAATFYWSSTTFASDPIPAWLVEFQFGSVSTAGKFNGLRVRAVRGGS